MPRAVPLGQIVLGEEIGIFELRLQFPRNVIPPITEVPIAPLLQNRQLGVKGVLGTQMTQLDHGVRCRPNDEQRDGVEE